MLFCLILTILLVKVQSNCLMLQFKSIQPDPTEVLCQNNRCEVIPILNVTIETDIRSEYSFNLEKSNPIFSKTLSETTMTNGFWNHGSMWIKPFNGTMCSHWFYENVKLTTPSNISWTPKFIMNSCQAKQQEFKVDIRIRTLSGDCSMPSTTTTTSPESPVESTPGIDNPTTPNAPMPEKKEDPNASPPPQPPSTPPMKDNPTVSPRPPSRLYLHKLAIMECIVVVNCAISICIYIYFGWYKRVSAPYIKFLEKMDKVTQKLYRSKKKNR